ncbi:Uncharacterised protein [Mycobacteroides abscessus subsp. abscessus]|nr:Uncharacterised protein [Mycobacteroides abscessus subsp. abscessus]SKT85782.1 Uncharacterised protein [Mycobacteroides abscessus subsp. abscessus]
MRVAVGRDKSDIGTIGPLATAVLPQIFHAPKSDMGGRTVLRLR